MRIKLIPTLADLIFVALLVWLFATGSARTVLLADGDTGWHIRNGEAILHCRCVPHQDRFAFGTEGTPWFAWEWLTDVIFAGLHYAGGLKAVVLFSGVVIAAASSILFRHMLWKGTGVLVSLTVVLIAAGASSIHFLARPHVLTLLLLAGSAWALDRDRMRSSQWIWLLPAVVALWTNLHGGFLAIFPLLALRVVESVVWYRSSVGRVRRDLALLSACALATFVNPYGWRLHQHLVEYLRSDWIRRTVEEFQSPQFRSESMMHFEILLVLGIAIVPSLVKRRNLPGACIILFWAHQALGSVRHVPIYCFLAAPFIAGELHALWIRLSSSSPATSFLGVLRQLDLDWSRSARGFSAATPAICAALLAITQAGTWPADFPGNKFPVSTVNRNWRLLGGSASEPTRVFSSDQWSDYLIYRLHPNTSTFFDGRSDFLGPSRGDDYTRLMEGRPGCPAILEREHVQLALLPSNWALASLLANDPRWEQVDTNSQAVLFRHKN